MNRQYQMDRQCAIDRFTRWAEQQPAPLQIPFPMLSFVKLAEEGLGELMRQVGKIFIETVMEKEVEEVVGQRSKPDEEREATRWGTEQGFCIIDGQKVPIPRPRVRSVGGGEIRLGSYELFQ